MRRRLAHMLLYPRARQNLAMYPRLGLRLAFAAVLVGLATGLPLGMTGHNNPTPRNCDSPWTPAFASPGACGFPDPAFGNVGVPSGTTLTPHGPFATSSMCTANGPCTIQNLNISGAVPTNGNPMVDVNTSNVTFVNDRFTATSGGCGPNFHCGNQLIFAEPTVSGTLTLSHVELTTSSGTTVEFGVQVYGGDLALDHVYQHGDVDAICWCPGATINDSYSIVHLAMANDHLENIYSESSQLTVNHSVLLNTEIDFTEAAIFAQTAAGASIPCANHITVTNSLLAGGGDTLVLCSHSTSAGTASLTVEDNRFARCITTPIQINHDYWHCQGGPDNFGYAPFSGVYGWDSESYCGDPALTWTGNKWDNDGSTLPC